MSEWTFHIPGEPPSVNHSYHVVRGTRRIAKNPEVENYQTVVTWATRTKVKDFAWSGGFVRVRYRFFLGRAKDVDNMLKALNDAIAIGLGMNDRWFLPCVESVTYKSDVKKALAPFAPGVTVSIEYPIP
jgi:Holliday junction resolvase RusA-like endonuclease